MNLEELGALEESARGGATIVALDPGRQYRITTDGPSPVDVFVTTLQIDDRTMDVSIRARNVDGTPARRLEVTITHLNGDTRTARTNAAGVTAPSTVRTDAPVSVRVGAAPVPMLENPPVLDRARSDWSIQEPVLMAGVAEIAEQDDDVLIRIASRSLEVVRRSNRSGDWVRIRLATGTHPDVDIAVPVEARLNASTVLDALPASQIQLLGFGLAPPDWTPSAAVLRSTRSFVTPDSPVAPLLDPNT